MSAINRDQDARRFQAWQLDALRARHTDSELISLDAANDEAAKVYEKLGFTRFGAQLVYR